jgi:hypothetical protein
VIIKTSCCICSKNHKMLAGGSPHMHLEKQTFFGSDHCRMRKDSSGLFSRLRNYLFVSVFVLIKRPAMHTQPPNSVELIMRSMGNAPIAPRKRDELVKLSRCFGMQGSLLLWSSCVSKKTLAGRSQSGMPEPEQSGHECIDGINARRVVTALRIIVPTIGCRDP